LGLAIVAFAFLSGCAPSQYQREMAYDREERQRALDQLIGHEFWVRSGGQFLVYETDSVFSPTKTVGGKLRIDYSDECGSSQCMFHVTFANGVSGFIYSDLISLKYDLTDQEPLSLPRSTVYPSFLAHMKGKDVARRSRLPGVALGMYPAQVIASAWGDPDRKTEIRTRSGQREKWFYPEGNELIFESHILVGIKK